MMISVWSGTPAAVCACCTFGGGEVTSVALVPGAGDWPVVCGCASCAKAGVVSAVEARNPSASARTWRSIIAKAPLQGVLCRYCDRRIRESQRLVCFPTEIVPSALRKGRGSVGVSVEDLAQRGFQRSQMRFVGTPLLGRLAINRPPHLLGAWSPHSPLGLVEFEHLGFEVEPAKIEQRPNLG